MVLGKESVISKNSDIGTLANKISKADFADYSIVKVITENNIKKNKITSPAILIIR